ncbi:MAG: Hsp33 family molecular chaperone HslO [Breznakia sp.]
MKNQLLKAVACEGRVRLCICDTSGLVDHARKIHDLWPTASAALGRVLSVASMMGANLKSDHEKINIIINGGGPIGSIMVDAYYGGNVRGFVAEPHVHYQYNDTKKLAVGVAVGSNGFLEVIKDFGMKENFGGKVALQSGEIGDDFSAYFLMSEQIPSVVSLGVLVDSDHSVLASGGLLMQLLPEAKEEDIRYVEKRIKTLAPMSKLIHEGNSLEDIANQLFEDVKILQIKSMNFVCDCSKEKTGNALRLLNVSDLEVMIKEDKGAQVSCQYCATTYAFTEDELKMILASKEHHVENR